MNSPKTRWGSVKKKKSIKGRRETGDGSQEKGDRRPETEVRRPETEDRRTETGVRKLSGNFFDEILNQVLQNN